MAELLRTGDAVWQGDLRGGNGKVSTGSGAIREQAYSFRTRFENEPGHQPGRADRGGPRGMLQHGVFGRVSQCWLHP